jgi:transcriptional regulator with XRE-family HTH domain
LQYNNVEGGDKMFGQNLRELRKRYNLTIEELALNLDSNYSTVAMWENKNRHPDYDMLVKIADYFNVTTDMLLGRVDMSLTKPVKYLKICKKAESLGIAEEDLASLLETLIRFKKG